MKRNDHVELWTSYESPKMEILQFGVADVITSSGVKAEEEGAGFEMDGSGWY